jgi:hypothetical protein
MESSSLNVADRKSILKNPVESLGARPSGSWPTAGQRNKYALCWLQLPLVDVTSKGSF